MSLAPPPDADPGILAGIDREVDKIIGHDDGETLDELETLRQNYLFWYYIGLIAIITATILGVLTEIQHNKLYGHSKGFTDFLMFAWILIVFAGFSPILMYKNKARQILMPALVGLFGDLRWSSHTTGDEAFWQGVRTSDLIGSYDSETVMDFITGSMKGINVTLAEMTLTRGSGKSRVVVFHGAGIHIRLQKPVPLRLILKPRAVEWRFFTAPDAPAEVNIPSPDFARAFRAFSDDQVLARTLLTPDVVEQLTKLNLLFGNRHLGASLRGDNLFLVAHGPGELAPESLFTSAYKLDRVHKVGRQLYLLSTLIDTIMKDWRLDAAPVIEPASFPAPAIPAP